MDASSLDSIRSRLLRGSDAPSALCPEERPVVLRELTRLLVSRTLLQQFTNQHDPSATRAKLLGDERVQAVVKVGLDVLSDNELGMLLTSNADLENACDSIFRLSGEHRRADCWWVASVAEGRRLMDENGERAFYDAVIAAIENDLR